MASIGTLKERGLVGGKEVGEDLRSKHQTGAERTTNSGRKMRRTPAVICHSRNSALPADSGLLHNKQDAVLRQFNAEENNVRHKNKLKNK